MRADQRFVIDDEFIDALDWEPFGERHQPG
jgi:hypothetical protein